MADIRKMQIGQIVDFVVSYNERQKKAEKQSGKERKRKASQNDIDAWFG